jgi:CheY-like chemotaxis protein
VRFCQILINLLSNAIKLTEKGGITLIVELHRAEVPQLRVRVCDTGVGLSAEQVSRLFTPFTQLEETMSRRVGGTGLGLAIVRRLSELLGGDVHVNSRPGTGSTFSVTVSTGELSGVALLRQWVTSGSSSTASALRRAVSLRARVLLVEDSPDNQRLIKHHLTRAGAVVDIARNGRDGLDAVLSEEASGRAYDVVLMDMQMPELDGYAATSMLRAKGYRGAIVAVTAHAMAGEREHCLAAGCDDYVTKPIDAWTLVECCARWTDKALSQQLPPNADPSAHAA